MKWSYTGVLEYSVWVQPNEWQQLVVKIKTANWFTRLLSRFIPLYIDVSVKPYTKEVK